MLLTEKTNNLTSEMPYLDKLSEEFRNANWKSVDGQLWVGKSLQVSNWEASVQKKAAKLLSVLNVNKVLEIGYGLGMFSAGFMEYAQCCRYVILEAHPEIAIRAMRRYQNNDSVDIICDFWEHYLTTLDEIKFDAIYFDAYLPLDNNSCTSILQLEQVKHALINSIPTVSRVLRSGGVLSFLDMTCQINLSHSELNSLGFGSFDVFKEQVKIPDDCPYATGKTINIIQMRKL